MPVSPTYRAAPRITTLGDGFYDEVSPARFPKHELRFRNQRWAERVGLGGLDADAWNPTSRRSSRSPRTCRSLSPSGITATSSTCTTRISATGAAFFSPSSTTTPGASSI